jgi:hypothetical protein
MPARTPGSLPSQPVVYRHLAFIRTITRSGRSGDNRWLTTCYQLTLHLQRLGHDAALLDLGPCTDDEAVDVLHALLAKLRAWQIGARAAIGPSGILAQLALLRAQHAPMASIQERLTMVMPEQAAGLLGQVPIAALARMRLPAPLALSPEIVARLEGYWVRTLGQLARLDAARLRRQFGGRAGTTLATVARGDDPLPLQPTPAPQRLHFRLRSTTPATPDRLLADLALLAREVANVLARRGAQASTLELWLSWEAGTGTGTSTKTNTPGRVTLTRTLVQPVAEARTLVETLRRLLFPLFQATPTTSSRRGIEDLRLIVSDLTPRYPAQHSFWPARAQRLTAVSELAERLAQRHDKPVVLHGVRTAPDAIFDRDRSGWAPLGADVAEGDGGLEEPPGGTRPYADAFDASEGIPHGIHWW